MAVGEERGGGVAAHQPVTDLGQAFGIGDRRQQVAEAGGGAGIEARLGQPTQQCPLLVDTLRKAFRNALCVALLTAFHNTLSTTFPEPLLGPLGDPFHQRHARLLQRPYRRHQRSRAANRRL